MERHRVGACVSPPTHFFKEATISPFKKYESGVLAQYDKLFKKARERVDFLITQVGFDARKFDEFLRFRRHQGIPIPIFGNVYILNQAVANLMNRGGVPGCVVTDELYRIYLEESKAPDKGKKARLTRAAKLIGVLKGIGYDGVHIGGPSLRYEDAEWVVEKSKEFSSDWEEWVCEFSFPERNGFYLFEKDPKTGLNTDVFIRKRTRPRKAFGHEIMRLFHHLAFTPQAPLYRPAQWFYKKIDGIRLEGPMTELEYWVKFFSSRCRRCEPALH